MQYVYLFCIIFCTQQLLIVLLLTSNINQTKHPWNKIAVAEDLKRHAEKLWNQNGQTRPSVVDEIKMMTRPQNNVACQMLKVIVASKSNVL